MKYVFLFLLALSAVNSQADGNGPCKTYKDKCSGQGLTAGHGLYKCMAQEAKAANDQACLSKMKEMRAKKQGGSAAEGAAQ